MYTANLEKQKEIGQLEDFSSLEIKEERMLMTAALQSLLKNRTVLEVACGNGIWTSKLSHTAKQIMATDIDPRQVTLAKRQIYYCPVTFQTEDAFNLSFSKKQFNAAFGIFWLSYIPKNRIPFFLEQLHRVLRKDSIVFFADTITDQPESVIKNGRGLDVLSQGLEKQHYNKEELFNICKTIDININDTNMFFGKYLWFMHYQI